MGWRPRNLNDSLFPVQTLFAIIGFHTFQYPVGHHRLLFSVIYTIIITLLYYVAFVCTVKHTIESSWFKFEELIFLVILCVNSIIAGTAQILSWYHMKRRSGFMEKIMKVDETLKKLGSSFDYIEYMNYGIAGLFYWLLTMLLTNGVDTFWFASDVPIDEIIIVITICQHSLHVNSLVCLTFALALRSLEIRFCKANKLLEDNLKFVHQRSLNVYSWFSRNKVNEANAAFAISKRRDSKRPEDRKNLVQIIKQLHLELTQISHDLDRSYGVQILMEIGAYFVLLTGLWYALYTIIVNPSTDNTMMRTVVIVMWLVIYSSNIMIINYSCERVTAEAKKTGDLIHCIDSNEDSECPDEIRQFSLQLLQNPLCFSPAGFFTLGLQFVRGFFGSVVTYLVILIQMGSVTIKS